MLAQRALIIRAFFYSDLPLFKANLSTVPNLCDRINIKAIFAEKKRGSCNNDCQNEQSVQKV